LLVFFMGNGYAAEIVNELIEIDGNTNKSIITGIFERNRASQ